jgi:hypothetical protein
MAITKEYNRFTFLCDECGDDLKTNTSDFFDALKEIGEEGWLLKRNHGDTEWLHICNECVNGNK